jgi:predicted ATPase
MLKKLILENFKGIKKADISFGKITVLIGPNGTGKSSISHSLMALKQSIGQNRLVTNGHLINLGEVHSKGVEIVSGSEYPFC